MLSDLNFNDSIISCSSANVSCAISLIRISTVKDISFFSCFRSKSASFEARKAYLVDLLDSNSEILDECVLTYFKAPHSFTGQNLLELSVHGNPLNVERIIKFFINDFNFRAAAPGEFTYRALQNDKLSVSQVEGLDVLLNSKSNFTFSSGLNLLKGTLNEDFLKLEESFSKLKSSVEMNIDFAEDIGEKRSQDIFLECFRDFKGHIKILEKRVPSNSQVLMPRITLFGPPNSGKSTLFNQLVGHDRSIVSSNEGTTRDYVSEEILIKGSTFNLTDTAGVRESDNEVESIGIGKSLDLVRDSFFKILVIAPSEVSNLHFFKYQSFDLLVISNTYNTGPMGAKESGPMGASLSKAFGPIGAKLEELEINIENGPIGANFLTQDISEIVLELAYFKFSTIFKNRPIIVPRYKDSINQVSEIIEEINVFITDNFDIGVLDHYLLRVSSHVNELISGKNKDEVLNNIFDNFCIGK